MYEAEVATTDYSIDQGLFYDIDSYLHPQCQQEEHQIERTFFEQAMDNRNFKMVEEQLEFMLDRAETLMHSMVAGMQKFSNKIR